VRTRLSVYGEMLWATQLKMGNTRLCHISAEELFLPSVLVPNPMRKDTHIILAMQVVMILLDLIIGEFYLGRGKRRSRKVDIFAWRLTLPLV